MNSEKINFATKPIKSKNLSMLILISPAKSLDFESEFSVKNHTLPIFLTEISKLISDLKKVSVSDLEKIFGVSKKLAELNFERFQNFAREFTEKNSRPALIAFDGDVYAGIDKKNFTQKDFDFVQNHLRILSGLYGLLRPLDLIQPYRLEMGTDFKKVNPEVKNLYQFWEDKICLELEKLDCKHIINLASEEYFGAVNPKKIKANIINIIFKEEKAGKLKIVGINAKKARGLMTNFIIKNKITNPEKLKEFGEADYCFNSKLSDHKNFVFIK